MGLKIDACHSYFTPFVPTSFKLLFDSIKQGLALKDRDAESCIHQGQPGSVCTVMAPGKLMSAYLPTGDQSHDARHAPLHRSRSDPVKFSLNLTCSACDDKDLVRRMCRHTSEPMKATSLVAQVMAKPELPSARSRESEPTRRLSRHTPAIELINNETQKHTVRVHSTAAPTAKKHSRTAFGFDSEDAVQSTKARQTAPVITWCESLSARGFMRSSYPPTGDQRRAPQARHARHAALPMHRSRSNPLKFPLRNDDEPALAGQP